jgi:hypothetical protein
MLTNFKKGEEDKMCILLIIFALIGSFIGLVCLSEATVGVGIICFSCLLAILARINQAYEKHKELMEKIDSKSKQ